MSGGVLKVFSVLTRDDLLPHRFHAPYLINIIFDNFQLFYSVILLALSRRRFGTLSALARPQGPISRPLFPI